MNAEDVFKQIVSPAASAASTVPEHAEEASDLVERWSRDTRFLGEIPAPDGYAFLRGECGDTLEVFLGVRDRRIEKARFDALGCAFTLACGSVALERIEGGTLTEALTLKPEEISEALGGLPASHLHCAELAAETVKKAVRDSLLRARDDPWKKLYRNR